MANAVIGALRVDLGLNSAQFQNGLKNAQTRMQRFGQIAKRGMMIVGAAIVGAAAAMTVSVKRTMDAADQMGKAAQSIGIPVDELSRLKHAADLSGASFGDLQTGVRRLSQSMQQFADGADNEATRALDRLGVRLTDADGNLRATSDVMNDVASAFGSMEDGAEKTAAAMAIFGRSGTNLIPMLNQGADGLQKMKDEADALGIVFTQEMADNSARFNDNLTRLQAVFGGLSTQLATELAPHLADFTDWLVENAPAIIDTVVSIVNFTAEVVKLGAAFAAWVSGAARDFIAAWDAITGKIAEVDAAIRAFINDIIDAFAALPGQMLQIGIDIMQGLIDGIVSMGSAVVDSMLSPVRDGVNSVKSWLGIQSPSKLLHGIGVNTMQGFADGMESMSDTIGGIADSIAGMVSGAFKSIIDGSKSVGDALKQLLNQVVSFMLNQAVRGLMGMLFGGGGFLSGIFGGFRAAGGPVSSGRAYVVGERGPELMVPNSSGTVIPNHALGGKEKGGDQIVNIINQVRGVEVEKQQSQRGDDTILDVIIKRTGETYGLRKPATAT